MFMMISCPHCHKKGWHEVEISSDEQSAVARCLSCDQRFHGLWDNQQNEIHQAA